MPLKDRTFVRILQDNQGKYKHLGILDAAQFGGKGFHQKTRMLGLYFTPGTLSKTQFEA
jgi:hypothetical protein